MLHVIRVCGRQVRERLRIPLGAVGCGVLGPAGKLPEREVTANLTSLKRLLEAGR
jgi:hypothetical protein